MLIDIIKYFNYCFQGIGLHRQLATEEDLEVAVELQRETWLLDLQHTV